MTFREEQIAYYRDALKESDRTLKRMNDHIKWCKKEGRDDFLPWWEKQRKWEYEHRRWYRKQLSFWVNTI